MSLIKQWWETVTGLLWHGQYEDRIEFNVAQRYVQAVERKDRETAERLAAGIKVPRRKRNQPKLRVCLDVVHRRVLGKGEGFSDGSIGGCYRTMTEDEYMGSDHEARANERYESLLREARRD